MPYERKTDEWERHWHDHVEESTLAPPPLPTRAVPGSEEKIAVLARRHSLRQRLWHPLDLRLWAGGRDEDDVDDLDPLAGAVLRRIRWGRSCGRRWAGGDRD